jgi:beta-galactosidase
MFSASSLKGTWRGSWLGRAALLAAAAFYLSACAESLKQAFDTEQAPVIPAGAGGSTGAGGSSPDAAITHYPTVPRADAGDAGSVPVFATKTRTDIFDGTINKGWKFLPPDKRSPPVVAVAQGTTFDDSQWQTVDLPHSWNERDGEDGPTTAPPYWRGAAWYRKHYTVPADMANQQIYLQFDASAYITDVWVNETSVGQHKGGYAAFRFDVTGVAKPGQDNVIAIRVDNGDGMAGPTWLEGAPMSLVAPLSGDFTLFGGIYRNLHVLGTSTLAISPMDFGSPGVYLNAKNVTADGADFEAKVMLANADAITKTATVEVQILDAEAKNVLWVLSGTKDVPTFKPTDGTTIGQEGPSILLTGYLASPHLWNGLADPYVHKVNVLVKEGAAVVDSVRVPFGFRGHKIDTAQGFFLNGKSYPLRGVNMHQDHVRRAGRLDIADTVSEAIITDPTIIDPTSTKVAPAGTKMIDHDYEILKEIGCNFVRYAHYQHSDYTYAKADELGIVAWVENALVNRISEKDIPIFQENTQKQYTELIKQTFNHPSVMFFSMSNEILIQQGPDPTDVLKTLDAIQKKLDPDRYSITANVGLNADGDEQRSANWVGDAACFNKYFGWYHDTTVSFPPWVDLAHSWQQSKHPNQPLCISEYGAGANPDPAYSHELPITEVSGNRTGGFQTEEYQAFYHEAYYNKIRVSPFLLLTGIWNLFDFASDTRYEGNLPGENTKGLVTFDRSVKKDAYHFLRANWSTAPFVHITARRYLTMAKSGWKEVKVYSNQPSVTLKLNGATVGTITDADIAAQNGTPHVFVFKNIAWAAGANLVQATAGTSTDEVTWTN